MLTQLTSNIKSTATLISQAGAFITIPENLALFKIIKSRNPNLTLCRGEKVESGKTTQEVLAGDYQVEMSVTERDSEFKDSAACVHACSHMLKVFLGQL